MLQFMQGFALKRDQIVCLNLKIVGISEYPEAPAKCRKSENREENREES